MVLSHRNLQIVSLWQKYMLKRLEMDEQNKIIRQDR